MCYFDTSAMLKLFVDEPDAQTIRSLYRDARVACTPAIAYVEVHRLLATDERMRAGARALGIEVAPE